MRNLVLALATIPLLVAGARAGDDARQAVTLPDKMQSHMRANMRDPLLAVSAIQSALATGQDDIGVYPGTQSVMLVRLRLGGYKAAMSTTASKQLETFANPKPERDYTIRIRIPEFTCLCPKTGQPDFATLHLEYVPAALCVELKSLKGYVWSFRNEGHFHEDVTNRILDDLVAATVPRFMRITAEFNVRGGIYTTVVAAHRHPEWQPTAPVVLP